MAHKLRCNGPRRLRRSHQYWSGIYGTGWFLPSALQQLGVTYYFHRSQYPTRAPNIYLTIQIYQPENLRVPFFQFTSQTGSTCCLRFLAIHYVKCLQAQFPETRRMARISCPNDAKSGPQSAQIIASFPFGKDVFRPVSSNGVDQI
jgi:hypothetical protein